MINPPLPQPADPAGPADTTDLTPGDMTTSQAAEAAWHASEAQLQTLFELSMRLVTEDDIHALYDEILTAAITLTQADAGTVQILNSQTQELLMLATRGFDRAMIEHFARVDASSNTSCGIALARNERTFVDFDVPPAEDPDGSLRLHVEAGYLSAQSTPLITCSGKPIGMVTTHWRERYRPTERELRSLDLLARQAADLIEQRQAAAALRQSEAQDTLLVENLPDVVFRLDRNLRHLYISPIIETITGIPGAEWLGKTGREIGISAAACDLFEEKCAESFATGLESHVEFENQGRYFRSRIIPEKDDTGSIISLMGITEDITERKQVEETLQRAAAFNAFRVALGDALRPLDDPIAIQEGAARRLGQYLGASRVMYGEVADNDAELIVERNYVHEGQPLLTGRFRMADFGKTLVAALDAGQTLVIPDIGVAAELSEEERAAYAAIGIAALAGVPLIKDGRFVANLNVHQAAPRPWTADEVALIEEVAEHTWSAVARARAEAALAESEARFRLLVEGARDYAMFILNLDNRITFWSGGAERVFGWNEAEALGQSGGIIFTPEDRHNGAVEQEIRSALSEGSAVDRRWHVRKDRGRLFLDGLLTRLDDETGQVRGFAKIGRDATPQRQAEEALQAAHAELERRVDERTAELRKANTELQVEIAARQQAEAQLQQMVSRLTLAEHEERRRIGQILHDDLQQFLYGIQLKIGFIQHSIETGEREELVAQAQQAIDWIDQAIATTRQLTVDLNPPVLPEEGLADALGWLATQMEILHNLRVEVKAEQRFAMADEMRVLLFQTIRELLFNVAKHAGTDQARVELGTEAGWLVILVSDKGQGFELEAEEENGFGLRSIRERLKLLGGRMELISRPGEGTQVTVYAPLEAGKGAA